MMVRPTRIRNCLALIALVFARFVAGAQSKGPEAIVEVQAHVNVLAPRSGAHPPVAVLWLKPLSRTPPQTFTPNGRYTLLQKDRMFHPHLLVIPVGSVVRFPNADPFFHNVFSLFNGKRFDLGLYEAGSAKEVDFSREGVSYIFCNIHPEMSAVVLALSTRLYGLSDSNSNFVIRKVPAGEYEMHIWIEGFTQPVLDRLMRRVNVVPGAGNLGIVDASGISTQPEGHLNKFGQPYDQDSKPPY